VGDIVFEADLTGGSFTYKSGNEYITKKYGSGHLHYTTGRTTHNSKSNWIEREEESYQRVIRTYTVDDNERKVFAIDAYKNSASLADLQVSVEVNSKRKTLTTDYTLVNGTTHKFVSFTKNLNVGDVLVLKTRSLAEKISSIGFYEVPENLSVNPLNNELSEFTPIKLIHLKRNIFDTINSHSNWDGGILGHTQKLAEINHFILNELTILKNQEAEVIDINYEDINQSSNILASILQVDQNLVQDAIDRKFKLSKKSYKNLLDNHTIEQMEQILINVKNF